jgi:hypothetical protein
VLTIIADSIQYDGTVPPFLCVAGQQGGLGWLGISGQAGEGGMLIIQARQYAASASHWSLGASTYGTHVFGATNGGHGVVTGDLQKVFFLPPPSPPSITQQPVSQTNAVGSTVVFSVAVDGTQPLNYQWSLNGTDLAGAVDAVLTLTNVQMSEAGDYRVVVNNSVGTVVSQVAKLSLFIAPPVIISPPPSRMVAPGGNVAFQAVVGGSPPFAYQWRRDGTDIPTGTNATLVLNSVQWTDNGALFSVVVSNAVGVVTSSPPAMLTVLEPPSIITAPGSQTVIVGANAAFVVAASGNAPLSYQWRFNGGRLSGATNSTFTRTNAQPSHAGSYTVVVTNLVGSVTSTPPAVLTVLYPPTITVPPASQTVVAGSNVALSVTASGTAPLSYQWQFNGTNWPGATNLTLVLTNAQATNAGTYTVVVTNPYGSVTSTPPAVLSVLLPVVINVPPASQTVLAGSNVTFSVAASGSTPLNYEWRLNGVSLPGATNATLTLTNVQFSQSGNAYVVRVSNPVGSVTSAPPAVLTVNSPPVITQQPIGQISPVGTNVTLTVAATGTPLLFYQWQRNGTNLLAATSSTLVLNPTTTNLAGVYSVVVSNAFGVIQSQDAMIVVYVGLLIPGKIRAENFVRYYDTTSAPRLESSGDVDGGYSVGYIGAGEWLEYDVYIAIGGQYQAEARVAAGVGGNFRLELDRTNVTGTMTVPYTGGWFTWITISQTNVWLPSGSHTLRFYANTGGYNVNWFRFTSLTMTPSVTVSPTSRAAGVGTDVTFTGLAGGSPPFSYQWQFNGTNLPAATNLTLVLTNVQLANAGDYTLRVTNSVGLATASATLVVGTVWLEGVSQAAGGCQFNVHSPTGAVCVVEASTNLVNWTPVATLTNGTGLLAFTTPVAGFPRRFYRVKAFVNAPSEAPLWLGAASLTTGELEFTLHSAAGKVCVIEASTNLVHWTPTLTVTNLTGAVSLTNAMTGFPYHFFRATHPQ